MARPVFPYDFETKGIEARPKYPPQPVGVALRAPGERKGRYYAWGHASNNNCTVSEGRAALARALEKGRPACHNGKFDHDVGETHLDLPLPAAHTDYEETEFLAFLADPYSPSLSLKPLAERYLGKAHTARDELRDWIFEHVPACRGKPKTWRGWAAYISEAPGDLVGRYAADDIDDTIGLYNHLAPEIKRRGMWAAYEREKRLMPLLLRAERAGLRIDADRLAADGKTWLAGVRILEDWLRKVLKTPLLDLEKNDDLADALEAAGAVKRWIFTAPSKTYPKGQRSTAWDNLIKVIEDQAIAAALHYRARLVDVVRIAIQNDDGQPWLARASGGILHTQWHQVRHSDERNAGKFKGARTGRLSSAPNFQNLTTDPGELTAELKAKLPRVLAKALPDLPNLRRYVLPRATDHVLLGGDYSQQEPRWLAHFVEGPLLELYRRDARADVYEFAAAEAKLLLRLPGFDIKRKVSKVVLLAEIYGIGLKKLAADLGLSLDDTKKVKRAYGAALAGLEEFVDAVQDRGKEGGAIRTWGGRQYYCEPAGWSKKHGREMTYEYKLVNYLIQGSSADQTKEATIRFAEIAHPDTRLQLLVHDELVFSVPRELVRSEAAKLKDVMESTRGDCPMRVDFETAATNWAEMGELTL